MLCTCCYKLQNRIAAKDGMGEMIGLGSRLVVWTVPESEFNCDLCGDNFIWSSMYHIIEKISFAMTCCFWEGRKGENNARNETVRHR